MDVSKSRGPDLLPSEFPPDNLFWPRLRDVLKQMEDIPRLMFAWTIALSTAFEIEARWRGVPGYRSVAYGFADPEFEKDAFGVLVYAAPMVGALDEILSIEVGPYCFPIFVRRSLEILHSPPNVHPLAGTAGCWAMSRRLQTPGNVGFLTAKHVLGSTQIGSPVSTTGGYGTLLDTGPDGIDAALVGSPGASSLGSSIDMIPGIWPWMDVYFDGRQSGRVRTKVVAVSDSRGTSSPYIPQTIYLAKHGQQSDSGALVMSSDGKGVGLYRGALQDPSGRNEGFAQHLGQIAGVMSLTLYD